MKTALLLLGLAVGGLAACSGAGPGSSTAPPGDSAATAVSSAPPDSRHEKGRAIYNFHCYYCHGYSGDAKTLAASYLSPAPRDFTASDSRTLSRERMIRSVRAGRPGTAMAAYGNRLSAEEIEAVVDFIRREFMQLGRENTRYHTPENGWADHERYSAAYPFARGELPLDTPDEALNDVQRAGKRLFLGSCMSCHDRGRVVEEGPAWEAVAVSYPRHHGMLSPTDAVSSASVYARHDVPPVVADLTPDARVGETLYQENCAFCHAADGTGRNWIGAFLDPRPRDLTAPEFWARMDRERLLDVIRRGLPGTSMPAWKDVLDETQQRQILSYLEAAFAPEGEPSGD